MYSPQVIARRTATLATSLGWTPVRSSPERVARLKEILAEWTIYDEDDNPIGFREDLPAELARAVENEREICRLDFLYWCENYAIIRASDDRLIPFKLNRAQRMLLSVWAKLEELGLAIYVQILKARQLGQL